MAEKLAAGEPSRRFKVRAVLKWFGAMRRGTTVVTEIESALTQYGLATVPTLGSVGIDEQVRFVRAGTVDEPLTNPNAVADAAVEAASHEAPEPAAVDADPVAHVPGIPSGNDDELEGENGEESPKTQPDDRPVTSESRDWTVSVLRDKYERGQLDLQPRFQREYVWASKPELPSRLIESVLLEIPIPPIYFGKLPNGRWEVIDGQQRLTTLVLFVSNKFPLTKVLRMSSLNGRLFRELSEDQQGKILDAGIRSIVIDTAGNTELRYEIFERLNRGSMQLNEQELRNCVYRGPFNELLAELERDQHWRRVKGVNDPEPRFKEREMILRFFAFANRLPQYTGNLKRFLNEYMGQFAPREDATLKAHATLFRQTMQNVYAVFGNNSARLYEINPRTKNGIWDAKLSIMAFDIQAAALMNRAPIKVQQAAEQIRELFLFTMLTDTEMQDAISKHTGSTVQTKLRFTKFCELVDPIIQGTVVEPRFFDFQFREELWKKSHSCQLCKNAIHSFEDSTVDHILPYSKGGKTVPENAQLAHRSCNASKNAQVPTAGAAFGA